MKFSIFLFSLGLFIQEPLAQVRTFNSVELKGIHKAFLEVEQNGAERLIGFWKYDYTHSIGAGVIVLDIVGDRLEKVWEDNSTLSFVQDWDSKDINGDGRLDFAIAGSGNVGQDFRYFIAFYLSDGENQYQKQLFPQGNMIHHLSIGDINGDGQIEILFTEQFESHPEGEFCGRLELRLKVGKWIKGALLIEETEITLGTGDDWDQWLLGDVDNDGKDEAILHQYDTANEVGNDNPGLGRSILVYDLDEGITPTHIIQRPGVTDTIPILSVNEKGQILAFKKGDAKSTVIGLDGGFFETTIEGIPEANFRQWSSIQMNSNLILSEPVGGSGNDRQITIYNNEK